MFRLVVSCYNTNVTSDTIARPKTAPAVGLPKPYPIHPQIAMKDRGFIFCCKSFIIDVVVVVVQKRMQILLASSQFLFILYMRS